MSLGDYCKTWVIWSGSGTNNDIDMNIIIQLILNVFNVMPRNDESPGFIFFQKFNPRLLTWNFKIQRRKSIRRMLEYPYELTWAFIPFFDNRGQSQGYTISFGITKEALLCVIIYIIWIKHIIFYKTLSINHNVSLIKDNKLSMIFTKVLLLIEFYHLVYAWNI